MVTTSKSHQFRLEREDGWKRLEELVGRVEKKGLKSLSAEELYELPQLYRGTLSGLSVARAISLDMNVVRYLEGLSTRAYFIIYGTRSSTMETIREFFSLRLPQAIRAAWLEITIASAVMLIGVLVGLFLTLANPDWFYTFVDQEMASGRTPMASTEELKAVIDGSDKDSAEGLDIFSTYLFTHNAEVGMFAFALGFAFGLPTLWLLFTTGTMLGAFIALYASRGLGMDMVAWLMIHGTTELFAVILCGAAGLVIARNLAFPGTLGRMENLSTNGKSAALVVVGGVVMFLVAGGLEGFARQLVTDTTTRLIVAAVMLAFWLGYFYFGGRERDGHEGDGHEPDQLQEK
jgi:uncharacterized membrane protein SpoIIM required for sporulation